MQKYIMKILFGLFILINFGHKLIFYIAKILDIDFSYQ
jgi:hypothetical protein